MKKGRHQIKKSPSDGERYYLNFEIKNSKKIFVKNKIKQKTNKNKKTNYTKQNNK